MYIMYLVDVRLKAFLFLDPEFWAFTFDQSVEHDLPSTIHYILEITKTGKLHLRVFDDWLVILFHFA